MQEEGKGSELDELSTFLDPDGDGEMTFCECIQHLGWTLLCWSLLGWSPTPLILCVWWKEGLQRASP